MPDADVTEAVNNALIGEDVCRHRAVDDLAELDVADARQRAAYRAPSPRRQTLKD